ncbi:hypothetical protein BT69DRAFT_1349847 [Atractiella rhizophila]|nr:hypothetical protein BT69DRAFT_1349847 [Atractiella rhizophila]
MSSSQQLALPPQRPADSYQHAMKQLIILHSTYLDAVTQIYRIGRLSTQTSRYPINRYSEYGGLAGLRLELKKVGEKWEHCLRDIERVILHAQAVLERDYRLAQGIPEEAEATLESNTMEVDQQDLPPAPMVLSPVPLSASDPPPAVTPSPARPSSPSPKVPSAVPTPKLPASVGSKPPTPKPATPNITAGGAGDSKGSPIVVDDDNDTDSLFGDHLFGSSGSGTKNPPTPAMIATPVTLAAALGATTPQKPSPLGQTVSVSTGKAEDSKATDVEPTKLSMMDPQDLLNSISSILPPLPDSSAATTAGADHLPTPPPAATSSPPPPSPPPPEHPPPTDQPAEEDHQQPLHASATQQQNKQQAEQNNDDNNDALQQANNKQEAEENNPLGSSAAATNTTTTPDDPQEGATTKDDHNNSDEDDTIKKNRKNGGKPSGRTIEPEYF